MSYMKNVLLEMAGTLNQEDSQQETKNVNLYLHDNTGKSVAQVYSSDFHGYFPKKPEHSCNPVAVAKIINDEVKVQFHGKRVWRDQNKAEKCEGCFYERIWRICKQIEDEFSNDLLSYGVMAEKDFIKLRNKKAQQKYKKLGLNKDIPYISPKLLYFNIPQEKGYVFSINNQIDLPDFRPIPLNYGSLFAIIAEVVENMPEGSRMRTSKGFGGQFSGSKGNSQNKMVNPSNVKIFTFHPTNDTLLELAPYKTGKGRYNLPLVLLMFLLEKQGVELKG